jgi:SsrA-binding protein
MPSKSSGRSSGRSSGGSSGRASGRSSSRSPGPRPVAQNRKARHDYDILDRFEAGLVLAGSEVKSIRAGKVQLRDSYARVQDGEVWLHGVHVAPYAFSSGFGSVDPDRPRKLLLNRREINELQESTTQDSLTLVPLSVYFKDGRAKVDLALARGRRKYDKRHAIAARDAQREAARALSGRESRR